jgi:hypothetical protein
MTTNDLAKLRTEAEAALRLNDGDVNRAAPTLQSVTSMNF